METLELSAARVRSKLSRHGTTRHSYIHGDMLRLLSSMRAATESTETTQQDGQQNGNQGCAGL